ELNLAIEIDGSSHDGEEAQQRDRERQSRLEDLGVRFLRFTEAEAIHQTEAVLQAISAWISEQPTLP
ncbi:MAG: endonuclease domain-containing protein, partial [Prochlorotrichaceae cyanobacterium]